MKGILPFLLIAMAMTVQSCSDGDNASEGGTHGEKGAAGANSSKVDSTDAATMFDLAQEFHEDGDLNNAYKCAYKAVKADSSKSYYWVRFGDIALELGRPESKMAYDNALTLDPMDKTAHLGLGKVFVHLEDPENAFKHLNDALKLDEHYAEPYYWKGIMYKQLGNEEFMLSSFITSVQQDPSFLKGYLALGAVLGDKLDPRALDHYESALRLDPGNINALYGMGMYYQGTESYDSAKSIYKRLQKLDEDFAASYHNLGYIYESYDGKLDSALYFYREANIKDPYQPEWHYQQGMVEKALGLYEEAKDSFKQCLTLFPEHAEAKRELQNVYR